MYISITAVSVSFATSIISTASVAIAFALLISVNSIYFLASLMLLSFL